MLQERKKARDDPGVPNAINTKRYFIKGEWGVLRYHHQVYKHYSLHFHHSANNQLKILTAKVTLHCVGHRMDFSILDNFDQLHQDEIQV